VSDLSISTIGTELLDDPGADPAAVTQSLRNIARANRWFGGAAAVRFGLARTLSNCARGETLSLLDLGTGCGDLPRTAVHWGARRGLQIIPLGLELNRAAARLASTSGIPTAVACAGTPPLRAKSVDVILVSQLAHHLTEASIVHLLRVCDQLARRAVIVADLRRHALAVPSFWCGARLLGFDSTTVGDGVTSIRRGFRRRELLDLMAQAGVRGRVDQRHAFRLVATWYPSPH